MRPSSAIVYAQMVTPHPRPAPERASRRLRLIGRLILVAGLAGAGATYWVRTAYHEPTPEELIPGYAQATKRQMGILYGQTGAAFLELLQELGDPGPEAVLMAGASLFVAWRCFRAARPDAETDHAA
jgi:hypothetical protein